MLNEKFRERVPAWAALINKPDLFPLFFSRVLELSLREEGISFVEQTAVLTFLVNAVNSVEVDLVRKEIVKISSLNVLVNLFPVRFSLFFLNNHSITEPKDSTTLQISKATQVLE